jgi:NADH-quinone oxidoreductase subunit I
MPVVVQKKKLSLGEKLYVFEIVRGMVVTMRHFLRNFLNPSGLPTLNYPEEKRKIAPNYRGLHRLLKKENGDLKCTACKLCAAACPSRCISIEMALTDDGKPAKSPAKYVVDLSRCVFCGFCVEACPFGALDMSSGIYELAHFRRDSFVYSKERLSSN